MVVDRNPVDRLLIKNHPFEKIMNLLVFCSESCEWRKINVSIWSPEIVFRLRCPLYFMGVVCVILSPDA